MVKKKKEDLIKEYLNALPKPKFTYIENYTYDEMWKSGWKEIFKKTYYLFIVTKKLAMR